MFIVSFLILTIGEILASPQIPAWVDDVSDPNAKGHAQGLLTMFVSLGRAIGPLYGGLLIDSGSYKLLFTSVFIIMLFFIILTWLLSNLHKRA
jgi:MFS family permease